MRVQPRSGQPVSGQGYCRWPFCGCGSQVFCKVYGWRQQNMCDGKPEKLTKIDQLIKAIERLSHQLDQAQWCKPPDPSDKLKNQIDRLEKLIG